MKAILACRIVGWPARRIALIGAAFAGFLCPQLALGQSATPATPIPKLCAVVGVVVGEEREQEVRAQRWGTGLILGKAERFRTHLNVGLGATIVELEQQGERQVLLLRADANGQPITEDLSSSLAVAAGRAPWSRLDDLTIDFGDFPTRGRVGIGRRTDPARGGTTPPGLNSAGIVEIDKHIALHLRSQNAANAAGQ
jgi:hypothetical protein